MRLGLFGGCFDPIHFGHIRPVRQAQEALGLDRVVFLPTAVPPHKPGRQFASPHARYVMVELALLGEEGLTASPLELTPERPFYTVESLRRFRELHPQADLYLLMGCDSLGELHTWKDWREIATLAQISVLTRPDWRWSDLRAQVPDDIAALAAGDRVHFVANRPEPISATQIRERINAGERVSSAVIPELVLQYIRKYSLYR